MILCRRNSIFQPANLQSASPAGSRKVSSQPAMGQPGQRRASKPRQRRDRGAFRAVATLYFSSWSVSARVGPCRPVPARVRCAGLCQPVSAASPSLHRPVSARPSSSQPVSARLGLSCPCWPVSACVACVSLRRCRPISARVGPSWPESSRVGPWRSIMPAHLCPCRPIGDPWQLWQLVAARCACGGPWQPEVALAALPAHGGPWRLWQPLAETTPMRN